MRSETKTMPETVPFTPPESLMWQLDADPSLRMRIVGVVGLDQEPDGAALRDRVDRMARSVPRLRYRVVPSPIPGLRPHWELDPHFDLSYHLRTHRLPDGSGESDLLHLASLTRQDDFPAGRPPWRMLLVTGLPEGRAALIVSLHHVITDGVGAVRMASFLFGFDAAASAQGLEAIPSPEPVRGRSAATRLLAGITQEADQFAVLRGVATAVAAGLTDPKRAGATVAQATTAVVRLAGPTLASGSPLQRTHSPDGRAATITVPVAELKAAAKAAGGKLNDAYLAALVGGMRRYHDQRGLRLDRLVISMPVNLRRPDSAGQGGNEALLKVCAVPADIADPAQRIAAIRDVVLQEQTPGSHVLNQALGLVLSRLPGQFLRPALGTLAEGLDLNTTNVPGVPVPVYIGGARVESMYAFISRGRSPVSAALLSYNGTAHIGLHVDPATIPDVDLLASCIQQELEAVLALGQGAAHRLAVSV